MRAKKSLGQNFLRDTNVIDRIIGAVDLAPDDHIVEIGPGTGALTQRFVESGASVVAIEFDRDMVSLLNERFGSRSNFRLINTDVLDFDLTTLASSPLKLAANLPYNISTPVLQRLMVCRHQFERLVLMFQREVVDRISAPPGGSDRGFLSVLTEDAFRVERLFDIAPTAFVPVPKVWSSVIRLRPQPSGVDDVKSFRALVSAGFMQKRKNLSNNLKGIPGIAAAFRITDIDPRRRAETLTLQEWRALFLALEV